MTILQVISWPTDKTCDLCGAAAWWHLIPGDIGIVSQLCDEHWREFQRAWQRSNVEQAARMLPKKRTIVPGNR